ncbi:hypothetical protein AAMO2058_001013100 [Amorphochlora amoebiformis]|mmetsp:Transcript_24593/g.38767  ORF Transcript_24593/g.38767 Transcript_24593/m.38767 type:complete len:391 (-) Transcript_24593:259-1431(-)
MGIGVHLRNKYNKRGVLGHGAFARVWKVEDKKTKVMYAAKSIPKAKLNTDERNLVASEIKILSEINHPHCCMLIEAFESEKKIYLIQEIMRGPTLFDRFAQNSEEDITEWHVAICVQKIAKALAYLHSKGILHRDLKPQNIMFAKPASEDKEMKSLKLLDFGFAKRIDGTYTSTSRGTPQYVAPEVVFKNRTGRIEYGTSCDMWSLGVLIYELMSGTSPFDRKRSLPEFFKHVRKAPIRFPLRYWEGVSEEVKELILGLLEKNPGKRLTAEEVLGHPWIKDNCEEYEESFTNLSPSRINRPSTNRPSVNRSITGDAGKNRARNIKAMVGRYKWLRVAKYLSLMARMHSCMDALMVNSLGVHVDKDVGTVLKEAQMRWRESKMGGGNQNSK